MSDVWIEIEYILSEDEFNVSYNCKESAIEEILSTFLRAQIGAGTDNRPSRDSDSYTIRISLDTETDTFSCIHTCGNLGLRDGILLRYLHRVYNEL